MLKLRPMKYPLVCFSFLLFLSLLATGAPSRADVVGISSTSENPIVAIPSEDRSYLGADPLLLRSRTLAFVHALCSEQGEGHRVLGFRFAETQRSARFKARMPARENALPILGVLSPATVQWNYAVFSRKASRNFLHKNQWQRPQVNSPFVYGFPLNPVKHRDALTEVVSTVVTGGLYWVVAGIETAESKWADQVVPYEKAKEWVGLPVRKTGLYIRHAREVVLPLDLEVLACGNADEHTHYADYQYFGNIEEEFAKISP